MTRKNADQYLSSGGSTLGLGHANTLGSLGDLGQGGDGTVVAVGICFTALLLVALFFECNSKSNQLNKCIQKRRHYLNIHLQW